ncbi:MAG: TRAP transporter small permease subunit [Comamonadaceae bacterium]|nr:MAG: TRAP transporter small permease subunit [Comamonadaceae bacterium]
MRPEEPHMLASMERALDRVDWLLSRIAALVVLAVMFLIVCDVFGRYAFGRPLPWVYDLVSIYVINLVLYFMASEVLRTQSHIELDLKLRLLPRPVWELLRLAGWLAVAGVLALAAWISCGSMLESLARREVHPGLYEWPVWIEKAAVTLGLGLLTLRILLRCARFATGGGDASVFNSDEAAAAAEAH